MPQLAFDFGSHRWEPSQSPLLIAGPCVLENEDLARRIAEEVRRVAASLNLTAIFKASFDKANRTSLQGFRGPGMEEGLRLLEKIGCDLGMPVTTDVHLPEQAVPVSQACDLLQIPAFLARQTDLILACAQTGKPLNIKKGQFMAPQDMQYVVEKGKSTGNQQIMLCERGTFFGYGRLVNDMQSIPIMQSFGVPVIFDATHSVQMPGGLGGATGGNRAMVEPLARAAAAMGADGFFFETHPDPDRSPSDGPNMLPLATFSATIERIYRIWKTVREISA